MKSDISNLQTTARLLAWIKNHDEGWAPSDPPIRLSLANMLGGNTAESLFSTEYKPFTEAHPQNINESSAESLAQKFMACAEEDALNESTGYARVTRYSITSTKLPEYVFTVKPEEATRLDPEGFREEVSHAGLVAQLMRHLEAQSKLSLGTMEVQLEQARRTISEMRAEINQLYADRREQMRVFEEMMQMKHIRDMDIKRLMSEEQRMEKAGDMIAPLIPAIINKVVGQKLLPVGQNPPQLEMLRGIIGGLERPQFDAIEAALEPSQRAAFEEIVKEFYLQNQEELAKKAAKEKEAGIGVEDSPMQ